MALLDTTVFVDLGGRGGRRRKAEAQDVVRRLLDSGEMLVTSRINVAELYVGVELSDDGQREAAAIEDYLKWIVVLELDDLAARTYGRVRASLQRRGRLPGDMDILIAASAVAYGHTLVTRNPNHFRDIPFLTIIPYGLSGDN